MSLLLLKKTQRSNKNLNIFPRPLIPLSIHISNRSILMLVLFTFQKIFWRFVNLWSLKAVIQSNVTLFRIWRRVTFIKDRNKIFCQGSSQIKSNLHGYFLEEGKSCRSCHWHVFWSQQFISRKLQSHTCYLFFVSVALLQRCRQQSLNCHRRFVVLSFCCVVVL